MVVVILNNHCADSRIAALRVGLALEAVEGDVLSKLNEYLEDLLESNPDGDYRGANRYIYDGDTIEYEGETYYLWAYEGVGGVGCISYALTSTIDYNTLYNLSIEKDTSNRNCPIYAFLGEDMSTYKVTDYNDEDYVLLKVEDQ